MRPVDPEPVGTHLAGPDGLTAHATPSSPATRSPKWPPPTAPVLTYLDRNPARGRHRRVKERTRPASFLEADELVCVLDAAAALDERARGGSSPRREQIEALLAEGLPLTAIAGRLGLTPPRPWPTTPAGFAAATPCAGAVRRSIAARS